ncbi:hypothetical protein ACIQLJ_01740 [Microbacterium sp. NPDC091313]
MTLDGVQEPPLTDATFSSGTTSVRVDGDQVFRLNDLRISDTSGAALFASDFASGSIADFDVARSEQSNLVSVSARPAEPVDEHDAARIVDLTKAYAETGTWEAPAGEWIIQVFQTTSSTTYAAPLSVEAQQLVTSIIFDE